MTLSFCCCCCLRKGAACGWRMVLFDGRAHCPGVEAGGVMGGRGAGTEVGSGGVQGETHPNSESAQENEEATPDVPE